MSNGDDLNDRLEFKERIKKLPPEDQTAEIAGILFDIKAEMTNIMGNGYSKKGSVISAATITAVFLGVVEGLKAIFSKG